MATADYSSQIERASAQSVSGRALFLRIIPACLSLVRKKPVGTIGAVLLLAPVVLAIVLPGINLGPFSTPRLAPYAPEEYQLGRDLLEGPSLKHPMGTDRMGRDLFSRLFYGARLSFLIAAGVFAISTVLSSSLTMISAYYIRSVDLLLQRVIEIADFVPGLILLVSLFSIYGATPLTMVLTLGILGGIQTSRVLRSVVIGLRVMPFIEAAKVVGCRDIRIIMRHILPNTAYVIIIGATNALPQVIVIEAGLAILGFGIDPDYPTLGNLLNASRQDMRVAPHLAIFPGLVIFLVILGARLLGDTLRDVLDPRLRGSR